MILIEFRLSAILFYSILLDLTGVFLDSIELNLVFLDFFWVFYRVSWGSIWFYMVWLSFDWVVLAFDRWDWWVFFSTTRRVDSASRFDRRRRLGRAPPRRRRRPRRRQFRRFVVRRQFVFFFVDPHWGLGPTSKSPPLPTSCVCVCVRVCVCVCVRVCVNIKTPRYSLNEHWGFYCVFM